MLKVLIISSFMLMFGLFLNGTCDHVIPSPKENYQTYCASCHGKNLADFVDREWIYGDSWNQVKKSIQFGIEKEGMPSYKSSFSNKELDDLTSYILSGLESFTEANMDINFDANQTFITEKQNFKIEKILDGLNSPWGMSFLPNNDLIINDKNGKMYRKPVDQNDKIEIKGLPSISVIGQGGLLDVIADPNFDQNNQIYFSYARKKDGKASTVVIKANLIDDVLQNQEMIFEALPYVDTKYHFGSKFAFDQEGHLYLTVGDRGKRDEHPQYLDNHCGKVHRIHTDGSIPKDNPFVNSNEAMNSIYSYGHRNPQGIIIDPNTQIIWEHEHGPRGGDELNKIEKGKNYGWPEISYGINYNGSTFTDITKQEGLEQPTKYWVPSIAPCGMSFVSGDVYPNWENNILVGSLRYKYIERIVINNGAVIHTEPLLKNVGRLRAITQDNEGYIYFSVEDPGIIYKIIPE